jgi:DNA-binding transcriptional ArsR family regulator
MPRVKGESAARPGSVRDVPKPELPPTGEVTLTSPVAVRALAHPARLKVIDALYSGEVLTATECAAIAGITPSAMSYHLRALEKHGIVVRARARGDARERPWMRAGDTLNTRLGDGRQTPAGAAASGLLLESALALDADLLRRALAADSPQGTTQYSRDRLVLTEDEARALGEAIRDLVAPYLAEGRRGSRPAGAATYGFSYLVARDPDGS